MTWRMLTGLGDAYLMLPVAALFGLWLAIQKCWRSLWLWWGLLFGGAALVFASKVAFVGWGVGIAAIDLTCISGHAFFACFILPTVLAWRKDESVLGAGMLLGLVLALGVAVSRLALAAHSVSEVVAGLVLGLSLAAVFWRGRRWRGGVALGPVVVVCLLFACLQGAVAPTHEWVLRAGLFASGRTSMPDWPGFTVRR